MLSNNSILLIYTIEELHLFTGINIYCDNIYNGSRTIYF